MRSAGDRRLVLLSIDQNVASSCFNGEITFTINTRDCSVVRMGRVTRLILSSYKVSLRRNDGSAWWRRNDSVPMASSVNIGKNALLLLICKVSTRPAWPSLVCTVNFVGSSSLEWLISRGRSFSSHLYRFLLMFDSSTISFVVGRSSVTRISSLSMSSSVS